MKNIKKGAAALAVVVGFALYSWHAQHEESKAQVSAATSSGAKTASALSANKTSTSSTTAVPSSSYKDGTYTGTSADALYGYIQVKAVISGGKLADVVFLQHPNDQHESIDINTRAMPILKQEAIQAQTAQVDGVSGATDTTQAFIESLNAALMQARS